MTTLSELPFALQPLFSATEEGNTWLTSSPEDKQRQDVLWVLLAKDENPEQPSTWLEISITPQNYPAIGIGRIDETLSQMQNHIHTICDGWDVQKCNIDGIYVVDRKISVPCYAIEYDTVYGGGDYSGSGDIYYLQVPIVERIYGGNVEEAFADLSGHKLSNIIHWSPDNLVTLEGDEWEGTMNTFLF